MAPRNPNKSAVDAKMKASSLDAEGNVVVQEPIKKPTRVKGVALRVWRQVVDHMPDNALCVLDSEMLAIYCQLIADVERCEKAVQKEPMVVGAAGQMVRNPLWKELNECRSMALQYSQKLGLTPYARQQLKVAKGDKNAGGAFNGLLGVAA